MNDDVIIEQPKESDIEALRGLFSRALAPHYDGDHDAHLSRLIEAYHADGYDTNGFNSLAQVGYVARHTPGGHPIGYINLAIKRHGTAKVSPLIVDPSARRKGVGEALLNTAPNNVRMLYCTVSQDNIEACTFFIRQGFVKVGEIHDQYRRGKTELLLQRTSSHHHLNNAASYELVRVSEPKQWRQFTEISESMHVNQPLPTVTTVTYSPLRTETDPINRKTKTAYISASPNGQSLGGFILSKKKGGSTKLSTIVWANEDALSYLLTELTKVDEFRETVGRVYVHVPAELINTRIFQKHRWRLDALIPGLHNEHEVAAQWSTSPTSDNVAIEGVSTFMEPQNWTNYHRALREVITARQWDAFETPQELLVSLMAEVGELAEELQWKSRTFTRDLDRGRIGAEIVDIYNYLLRLSWHIDINLLETAFLKLARIKEKYPLEKARGTAKKYTELE